MEIKYDMESLMFRKCMLWIPLLFVLSNVTMAGQTKLSFQIPQLPSIPDRIYSSSEILEPYWVQEASPHPRGGRINVKKNRMKLLVKDWSSSFPANSGVHKFVVSKFVQERIKLEQEWTQALVQAADVRSIDYVTVAAKPLTFKFIVQGNRILFSMENLQVQAGFRVALHGEEKLLCGSALKVQASANVVANGSFDPNSGLASLDNIQLNEWVDATCNRFLGRIFDSLLDSYFKKEVLPKEVNKFIGPLLNSTVKLANNKSSFLAPARRAEQHLGFDFVDDAWASLLRYTDGLTLEFNIGLDVNGAGNHHVRFSAYQAPVNFHFSQREATKVVVSPHPRGGTNTVTYLETVNHFNCPIWAANLNSYNLIPIQTGETVVRGPRGNVAERIPIYGQFKFIEIPFGAMSYNSTQGVPFGNVASCTGINGLSSRLSAASDDVLSLFP